MRKNRCKYRDAIGNCSIFDSDNPRFILWTWWGEEFEVCNAVVDLADLPGWAVDCFLEFGRFMHFKWSAADYA